MQLNFKRYNDTGPVLVMMHGLFGSWENLGGIARHLTQHFQVYSLDMRNHGSSPHSSEMTLAAMALDVVEFLDAHQLNDVYLLGHSLGGKVMMEVALSAPQRVNKLVVADIAPVDYGVPRHDDVFAGIEAVDLAQLTSRGQADKQLARHITEPAIRSFILKNLARRDDGSYFWRINVAGIKQNYFHLIGANRADTQFAKPVLFIKGELSDYLRAEYTDQVTQRFPKAQVKVLSGTAHWLHAEKPELFAKLTSHFLAR